MSDLYKRFRIPQLMPLTLVLLLVIAACGVSCSTTSNGYAITPWTGGTAQAPVAAIVATPVGTTLEVQFSALASTDSDGSVVRYDWDWETDGIYDVEDGSVNPTHTYSSAGTYQATVKVTDNSGLTDTATSASFLIPAEDQPPSAAATYTPSTEVEHAADFDASTSTDDGTIVKYEWDWDDDDNYDEETTDPEISHTFDDYGNYTVNLRVTDDADPAQTDEFELSVTLEDPNASIVVSADLQANPTSGTAPLSVEFDASGSTTTNTSIDKYDWDWEGDGIYDLLDGGATPAAYIYQDEGTWKPVVLVTDDQGETATATVNIEVSVPSSTITVILQVDKFEGEAPLAVEFDASSSSTTATEITDWEWDFDGDGTFNETDNGESDRRGDSGPFTYTYDSDGDYEARVKVTDDTGNFHIGNQLIEVGPLEYSFVVMMTMSNMDSWEDTSDTYVILYDGDPDAGGSAVDQGTAVHTDFDSGTAIPVAFNDVPAGDQYYVRLLNIVADWDSDGITPTEEEEAMILIVGPIVVNGDHVENVTATQWRNPPGPQS